MIQRIQSLYLLLATIASAIFLEGNFLKFTNRAGQVTILRFYGVFQSAGGTTYQLVHYILPFALVSIIITIIAVLAIFLFKNRKLQLILTVILMILEILIIAAGVHLAISICTSQSSVIIPGFKMIMPFLSLLFSALAYRSIKKDDELVKSYDRLR